VRWSAADREFFRPKWNRKMKAPPKVSELDHCDHDQSDESCTVIELFVNCFGHLFPRCWPKWDLPKKSGDGARGGGSLCKRDEFGGGDSKRMCRRDPPSESLFSTVFAFLQDSGNAKNRSRCIELRLFLAPTRSLFS
jgi:hypothetical protein